MQLVNGGTATLSTAQALDLLDFRLHSNSELIVETSGAMGSTGWSFLGKGGTAGDTATMTMNDGLVQLFVPAGGTPSFIVGRESHGVLNMNGGLLSISGSL